MIEPKEQAEIGGVETMFGNIPSSPAAEEPKVETEEVDTPEVEVEPKAEEPQTETDEPKTEEPKGEPESEDGKILVSLDDEPVEEAEDATSLKAQNKALLEEIESLKTNSQLDPRIAKMNEFVNNGGDINANFWELQNKDYSSVNLKEPKEALSALRDKLKYLDGFESDEIDFHIEKNYPILGGFDEDADDSETREESMKLRMSMKDALPKLKQYQDKVRLPDVDNNRREQQEKQLNMYRAHSSSKIDEIESFDIGLDADTTLKIPFAGKGKQFARSIITEPENQAKFWGQRYATDNGDLDYNKFARDLYELDNRDKIYAAIYAQGQSSGKKTLLNEIQPEKQTTVKKPSVTESKFDGIKNMKFKRN